jgi:hypothetical protein
MHIHDAIRWMEPFLLCGSAMKNPVVCLMALLVVQAACIQIPEFQDPSNPPPSPPPSCAEPEAQGPIHIQWMSPTAGTRVGRMARFQVQLTGPVPDLVELLVDGAALARIEPTASLDWDTTAVTEGPHLFGVRAHRCGQAFVSEMRELTVDRTGPTLTARIPENGARWVSVHQEVRAELSEPVVAEGVNDQSVRLLANGIAVESKVTLSEDGKVLMLRPLAPLPVSEGVQVVFDSSVADLAGNPVTLSPQGWSWRVPAFLPLGNALAAAQSASVVTDFSFQMDAQGRPVVAWIEDGQRGVHVRRWDGTAWQALGAALRTDMSLPNALGCSLFIDYGTVPFVSWIQPKAGASSEIHIRKWDDPSRQWQTVSQEPPQPTLAQAIIKRMISGVDRRLHAPILVLEESNASAVRISMLYLNGSHWSSSEVVSLPAGTEISALKMEVDPSGFPVVAWSVAGETQSRKWTVQDWSTFPNAMSGPVMALVLNQNGSPMLAVPRWDADAQAVSVLGLGSGGGAWGQWGQVLGNVAGRTDAFASALAFDGQGQLIALVEEAESEAQPSARSLFVQRWKTDRWEAVGGALSANAGPTSVSNSQLALDKDGRIFLGWLEADEQDTPRARLYVFRPND